MAIWNLVQKVRKLFHPWKVSEHLEHVRRQLPESSKYSRDEINNDDDENTNMA